MVDGQSVWDEAIPTANSDVIYPKQLFGDGTKPTCIALEKYIASTQELLDSLKSSSNGKSNKRKSRHYYPDAVAYIAQNLRLKIEQELKTDQKKHKPQKVYKCRKYYKSWAFALLSYCKSHNQPIPGEAMKLAFEAMDCRSMSPDEGLLEDIGLASDIRELNKFREAAKLEGIADAMGKEWSENALHERVHISRRHVARWRERKDYKNLRQFECDLRQEHMAIQDEIDAELKDAD